MTEGRWDRLKELFGQAVELAPDERRRALESISESDPELGSELRALLSHHEEADAFLEEPATDIAMSLVPPAPLPEHRIGPYRIVRELGSGGMGSVYLGERDDELFEQRVAIKIVRPGLWSEAVGRRFEEERRILARLDHPNIARLLDGGLTPEGRPYLVMEFIEGTTLTTYVQNEALGVEGRLDLFQTVCRAVHFAHQNLVIHRDIKPSNILVDERGQPKLLDFGIAKLMAAEEEVDFALTHTDVRYLTTAYASPEQVRHRPLTTGSDVYSLGVVLYELLTGKRPLDTKGLSPADTERTILEREPQRPSANVDRAISSVPSRVLRGDLDTIVLKALRKEPERRYSSAEALLGDLVRYRAGLPIAARGDRWTYRTGKFVRRHRWGVAVAALVLTMTVVGTGTVLRQSVQVRQERDRAEAVSGVLVDVFQGSDPRALGQTQVSARDLLDRGVERIESRFAGDPVTAADLLDVIGQAYQNLGEFDRARTLMNQSLALRRQLGRAGEVDLAQSLNDLGSLALIQRDFQTAEPLLIESLAVRRRTLRAPHAEIAQSLNNLGQLRLATRDLLGADSLLGAAVEMQRSLSSEPDRDLAISLQARGLLEQIRGEFAEAEALYSEAADMQRAVLGSPHPDLAQTLNNLALLRQTRGDYAGAEPLYRESLEMREAMLGSEHPMFAVGLHNLALLLAERGDPVTALPLFERSLDLTRAAFGDQHPQTATALNNLGDAYRQVGALGQAEPALQQSLSIRREVLPPDHPHLAFSYNALGMLRLAQGRLAEAESLLGDAAALRRRTVGDSHPDLAVTLHDLGAVATAVGRPEDAVKWFSEALRIREAVLPAGHPKTESTRFAAGLAHCRAGRKDQGAALVRRAEERLLQAAGPDNSESGPIERDSSACL